MVGVFAGLKWRLVSSRIRAARGAAKVWLIIGWGAGLFALALVVLGFATLRTHPTVATTAVISLFSVQMVSWVLAPLVAFGLDETVDPARFALLPLTTGTLQRGLLVASLVGYLPVANAVVLIGAALALSSSWALLPIALLCSAAQLLLCVIVSRAASSAMSGLMSGRRGRDLGMVIGPLLFLVYIGLSFALNQTSSQASAPGSHSTLGSGVTTMGRLLSWGPNGALAIIPSTVGAGQWARCVVAAATVAAALALGWRWWSAALRTSLTTRPSTTQSSAPAHRAESGKIVADSLGGMIRLVMARDRLLTWRDPMRRIPWLTAVVMAVLWPFLVVKGHGSLFAVALPAVMMGLQAGNQYGIEGTGLWLHMVAFADRTRARGEAIGHAVFVLIPGALIIVVAVVLQAVIRGDLKWVPPALGLCLALMIGAIACTGYTSARLPYAMRQSRKSMFANSIPGQKGRTLGSILASVGGGIVVALPTLVLLILSFAVSPVWGWVALAVGPISGGLAVIAISMSAASVYLSRTPEILATVAVGDRN